MKDKLNGDEKYPDEETTENKMIYESIRIISAYIEKKICISLTTFLYTNKRGKLIASLTEFFCKIYRIFIECDKRNGRIKIWTLMTVLSQKYKKVTLMQKVIRYF